MSLNPNIAKQKPNGNIQCLVCNTEVKAKVWTAHVNGKKHRDSIERIKALAAAPKRPIESNAEEPPNKKAKESSSNDGPKAIPDDFFDGSSATDLTTRRKDDSLKSDQFKSSGVIEGLPKGFFDDKQRDNRVLDTREKNAILDKEFERWKEEIGEETNEQQAKEEETEAAEIRRLELERIDEQMAALKKLNELEIQKEKRLHQAMERRKAKEAEKKMELDEDDDDVDFDVDIDWRAKDIFS
ncbi:unnamed protein product [Caenorhabditis bovis]|uniref:ZNF380 coiled-coil domain-containing protein n=1 Tax=Caenorhabditis bovis TaxID=2654633 RepID=A0A8S1EKB9_9PELO|nr:unnamed protein product [Caenorhabditis bovis]